MTKPLFILREIFWTNLILIVMMLSLALWEYSMDDHFALADFPWFLTAFIVVDIASFFYNLYRLKKMGIDIGLPENQNGSLSKKVSLDLPAQKVLDLLKQNVWKFKTESKTETTEGTLVTMKYYRLIWNEKLEILIKEKNISESVVKITAGYKNHHKLMSAHSSWNSAIWHIAYFERELQKREHLHTDVNPPFISAN